ERPVIRPAIVGGPGRVAALEQKVAGPVVPDDEDDIALQLLALGGQLAEVDAARPVVGDGERRRRLPSALAQALHADLRVGLRFAGKRAKLTGVAASLTAVVAQAIEVYHERRRRVRADHDLQRLPGSHACPGTVALDPGTAIVRGRVYAGVRQHPVGRT